MTDVDPACWSWPLWTPQDLEEYKQSFSPAARARVDKLGDSGWALGMMMHWHAGRCAICGERDALIEDHDHQTGLIRGQLCRSCNVREGMNRDGVWEKYRQRNPATICGVAERYWDPIAGEYAQAAPVLDRWKDNAMRDVGL